MDNIKLICGDCFENLSKIESNTVDLVLIDPPYEISRDTNFASGKPTGKDVDRFRLSMNFGEWDKGFDISKAVSEAYRILKFRGTFICFYDLWKITTLREFMENNKFKQIRFIEWIKTNPVPLNSKLNYLTNSREIAVVGVKGSKPTFNSEYDNGIYRYPICHNKDRYHPTQKPIELIQDLINKHSNENDLVVDFTMGVGTTGVACNNLNRRFVGIEINEDYFAKCKERIRR